MDDLEAAAAAAASVVAPTKSAGAEPASDAGSVADDSEAALLSAKRSDAAKENGSSDGEEERELCSALLGVCTAVAAPGRGALSLGAVRRAVVRRRREFRGARQHDCHEFFSAVLDILSDELAPSATSAVAPAPSGAKREAPASGEQSDRSVRRRRSEGNGPSPPEEAAPASRRGAKGADDAGPGGDPGDRKAVGACGGGVVDGHFGLALSRTLSCLRCGRRRRCEEALRGLNLSVPAEDAPPPTRSDRGGDAIGGLSGDLSPPSSPSSSPPPPPPGCEDLIRQFLADARLDVECPHCRSGPARGLRLRLAAHAPACPRTGRRESQRV